MSLSSFIKRYSLVRQMPAFCRLNIFESCLIARKAFIKNYAKGDLIVREGDASVYFYCVISGRLQGYALTGFGGKDHIEFIHNGMYFGIVSLLTGENHSLTFEAMNDSMILQIPKKDFQNVLERIPKLGVEFSKSLSLRVRKKVKGQKKLIDSTIISVYSPVKGTGSSTYAFNLALHLRRETKTKVVLVSLRSQKENDSPGRQNREVSGRERKTAVVLEDVFDNYERMRDSIIRDDSEIDFLNVSFDLENSPPDILKKQIGPFVSTLIGDYYYVVVDLPNEMDDVVLETLAQSDMLHLVTRDQPEDLSMMQRIIDRLRPVLKANLRQEKVKVLVRAIYDQVFLSFEQINKVIGYDVYGLLSPIHADTLVTSIDYENLSLTSVDGPCRYSREIRKIARMIGKVRIGLVLGGGAALGIAHIGVLKILEKENIPVDIVAGSSMGALIGGLWAIGMKTEDLENVAREFEKKINILKLIDPVIPVSGLIGGKTIARWLEKYFGKKTFYSTVIPLKVIAYDLIRRKDIVLESGSLVDAVRQSISIPGVFEPVKRRDKVIIDGGVLNPLPVNVLTERGIKKIIAVNVLQSPDDVSRGVDMLKRRESLKTSAESKGRSYRHLFSRLKKGVRSFLQPSLSDIIVNTLQSAEYVIAQQSAKDADVLLHPDLVGVEWWELNRVNELIAAGEKVAQERLPEIKELIDG